MAFFSKVGNILKQTASKQINASLPASSPSIFQALRYMSSAKVFVGGISYGTDDQSLKEAFSKYGEVIEARVIVDRETGRSRGFGFVSYTSSEEASSAIQALDGQDLDGRRIRVNYANDRPRGGFGGGGAGGFGGGGYGYGTGGGGYGGGNYGGAGGGGNYGGNGGYGGGGDSYGSGGNYGGSFGGDSYGSGGSGGGSNVGYGSSGNYAGANTSEGGSSGGYGSGGMDFGVPGGAGGPDGSTDGAAGSGMGVGGSDQFGSSESMGQNDQFDGNLRDDDDDAGDFAKRA